MRLSDFRHSTLAGAAVALAGTSALTAVLIPFRADVDLLNEGLLFLLLTVAISAIWGRWAGIFAAVVTNLALNFFFIEPLYRFRVHAVSNVFGLAIFLLVSLVASSLLTAAREAAAQARRRQGESEALLSLSRAMIGRTDPEGALEALCAEALQAFAARGVAVLARGDTQWPVLASAGPVEASRTPNQEERSMANRAIEQGTTEAAGRAHTGARRHRIVSRGPARRWRADAVVMVPLSVGSVAQGVMRLDRPQNLGSLEDDDRLLHAFGSEAALTVQRLDFARGAAQSQALREADELKTALMMSISHDLKTPLASIKTSVSSLLDASVEWSVEDRTAFLETIDSQVDYLNRAISDILDLNRIESGAVRPILKQVRVADVLEDAVERSRAALSRHHVNVDSDESLTANIDSSLVLHALSNLLENAAKYAPAGTTIRLTARAIGGSAEIKVEDEGPGIAAEDRPRVFDRFYRARREALQTKGSGLGLALVKGFVGLSGGTVRVEPSEKGARFVLTFPLSARMDLTA